jgi:ABC-2 type transport system ATP-binding protein
VTSAGLAVETAGLTKVLGGRPVVDRLGLEVPRGAVFGFLGPNGAGKTTTIRMLLGLARPTSGEARVLGHDVRTARGALCRRVGATVEGPATFGYLTAVENLGVFADAASLPRDAGGLRALLARVGLEPGGKQRVGTYSMGMRQRLAIAIALLGDPEVLFLDEPTNGLDPQGAAEVRALLTTLREDGRTVFLSTHLLAEMERVCTHVGVISAGRLRTSGPVGALLRGAGYLLRVSSVDRALALVPAATRGAEPGSVEVTCDEAAIGAVVRTLAPAVDLREVRPMRQTLEQLYFAATAEQDGAP